MCDLPPPLKIARNCLNRFDHNGAIHYVVEHLEAIQAKEKPKNETPSGAEGRCIKCGNKFYKELCKACDHEESG
jgi:hypothetical protein